jgi:hypothetical protein
METPNTPNASELQFTTSESLNESRGSAGLSCAACSRPILDTYFAIGNQVLCAPCKTAATAPPTGSGFVRFLKAVLFGTAAGLLGAAIWYGIRIITNYEIGLIAVLVGFLVGKAIHIASGRRGGIGYQILAILITYCCIAANYVPDVYQALASNASEQETADNAKSNSLQPKGNTSGDASTESSERPVVDTAEPTNTNVGENALSEKGAADSEEADKLPLFVRLILFVLILLVIALATPVLMCTQSPISILIFGFALWEAWKFSAYHPLPITGPYQAGTDGANATPST